MQKKLLINESCNLTNCRYCSQPSKRDLGLYVSWCFFIFKNEIDAVTNSRNIAAERILQYDWLTAIPNNV